MSLWEVQKAIMLRLASSFPMFDIVPEGTARPYSTMGPMDGTPFRTLGAPGDRDSIVIHHWGDAMTKSPDGKVTIHGNKQIMSMAEAAKEALDGKPLALDNGVNVGIRWVQTIIVPDPNPSIRHATTRFRVDVR